MLCRDHRRYNSKNGGCEQTMREGGDEKTSGRRHFVRTCVCVCVCLRRRVHTHVCPCAHVCVCVLRRLSGDLSPLPRGVVNVGEE